MVRMRLLESVSCRFISSIPSFQGQTKNRTLRRRTSLPLSFFNLQVANHGGQTAQSDQMALDTPTVFWKGAERNRWGRGG